MFKIFVSQKKKKMFRILILATCMCHYLVHSIREFLLYIFQRQVLQIKDEERTEGSHGHDTSIRVLPKKNLTNTKSKTLETCRVHGSLQYTGHWRESKPIHQRLLCPPISMAIYGPFRQNFVTIFRTLNTLPNGYNLQDWILESQQGYKKSGLASQCTHM